MNMIPYSVILILLVTVSSACCLNNENKTSTIFYHGDKVFRLLPTTPEHLKWLKNVRLHGKPRIYDFWSEPRAPNRPVDIHVNKDFEKEFLSQIEDFKIDYSVIIPDLQKLIDKADAVTMRRKRRDAHLGETRESIVETFARHADINKWLSQICAIYPILTTCGSVGKSYEGRDIKYIKIGEPATNNNGTSSSNNKTIIYIEGGIHAREWLSHATTVYLINQLVTNYNSDNTTKRMLDSYDFLIVPVINPDGYEFSQTDDRMWRKTRSLFNGPKCPGADPNRNYNMSWGLSDASSEPCAEMYRGVGVFSEPETKAISDFISTQKSEILAFFSLHCYSQLWLVPYGDTFEHYPPDYAELMRVANIGASALMDVNKKEWQVGNIVDVLYAASGGGDDWAKSIGIKYAYTLELSPAGNNFDGFVVPETEIKPSGREVWAGITAAVDAMQIND